MHGLQQFVAFTETAKYGSFAAAARQKGVAPSTLAKAVGRLEDALGIKLFHRTTRVVTLTVDGLRLYERCQRILGEIENLQAEAAGAQGNPQGVLSVAAPEHYGRRYVLPLLTRLLEKHGELQLDLRLSDAYIDLVRDNIDLAVRVGDLRDSTLIARRIDRQRLILCASPSYLAARGLPTCLDDLQGHSAIRFRMPSNGRLRPWQFCRDGTDVVIEPPSCMSMDTSDGIIAALKLGMGLGQLPDVMVTDEIEEGHLVEVLPQYRPPAAPISLVYPSGRLLPARVRAAIDILSTLRQRLPEG